MAVELAGGLLRAMLAVSVGAGLVLVLRPLWRRAWGPSGVLWPWLLVPALLVAVSVPRPTRVVTAPPAPAVATTHDATTASPVDAADGNLEAIAEAALALWLLGAAATAIVLVRRQRRFHRHLGTLTPRGDGVFSASVDDIGPVLVGVWRPRIVVPADFERRFDARQRELVLAHERIHLARGDLHANAFAATLRCVSWFDPLVHFAASRLRIDQELACDAAVLRRHPAAARDYATALFNAQLAVPGLPVGCQWQSSHPLKWRIAMLKNPAPGAFRLVLGAALAASGSAAAATTLWQQLPHDTVVAVTVARVDPAVPDVRVASVPPVATPSPAAATTAAHAPATIPAIVDATTSAPPATPARHAPADGDAARHVRAAPPVQPAPVPSSAWSETASASVAPPVTAPADDVSPVVVRATLAKASRSVLSRPGGASLPTVLVQVDVDAAGRPSNAALVAGDVGGYHRATAESAVLDWTFAPARRDGVAVASTIVVPVDYATSRDTSRVERFWADAVRHPRPMGVPPPTPSAALTSR